MPRTPMMPLADTRVPAPPRSRRATWRRRLMPLAVTLALAACGGGGPTSPSDAADSGGTPLTALPIDGSAVRWMGPYGPSDVITFHNGIDLGAGVGARVFAAGSGTVEVVEMNTGQGLPGTNYRIRLSVSGLEIEYHFEIDGSVSDADRQANVLVREGQAVTAGQHIANLLSQGDGAHVHFGVLSGGTALCPLDRFTPDVAAQFESLYDSGIEKRPASRGNLCP